MESRKDRDRRSGPSARNSRIAAASLLALALVFPASVALGVQPGDTEPNEVVDLRDLLAIRNAFGQTGAPGFTGADVNGDGVVDNTDITIWRQNFPFVGDVGAPYLTIFSPLDGSLIGDRLPTVVIDYSPTSLNLDLDTLEVVVDGVDRSTEVIKGPRSAALLIEQALTNGPHYVEATLQDVQGTQAMARSDFELTPLTLRPRATPQSGPAPLTVRFFPDVIWADHPPSHYLWDWDNNGTWDNGCIGCFDASARPDALNQTFSAEGLHTIRFGVYQGATATLTTTTLQIAVTETLASASPSNGTAPLSVFLHGIAADLDDPITLYEWDFDHDGTFSADYSSATDASTANVYVTAGVYQPVFRATHLSGAVVEHPIFQTELHVKAPNSPIATAAASQGANALTVNFAGSGQDNGSITLYEWDFENDGVWDYSSPTTGVVSHTFPTAGARVAALRVTDNDGNFSIDRVRFETFAPAELEVLDDTVVPSEGEQVIVRTTTTIESTVWLSIRGAEGQVVRTLVNNEVRPAGTYDDAWDGRDFRFEPAHPGAYYAVLLYSYPGRTDVVDLTHTTGGQHYFAPQTTQNPSGFDPFADDFWVMGFTIPSASRASLYILPGGSNRTDTPFDNMPLGAGGYTYYWAGLTSAGQLAPAIAHLWSVNAWTLGDNAIVVKDNPQITSLDVDPNLFSPTDKLLPTPGLSFHFTLDRASAVLAKLIRIDNGITLRSWTTDFLSAGPQSIVTDGRASGGEYLGPGDYRFSMIAVDDKGNISLEREAVLRVGY